MSPISKNKTPKRMSSTPGMTAVKKRLRKFTNWGIRDDRLFTDGDDPVGYLLMAKIWILVKNLFLS